MANLTQRMARPDPRLIALALTCTLGAAGCDEFLINPPAHPGGATLVIAWARVGSVASFTSRLADEARIRVARQAVTIYDGVFPLPADSGDVRIRVELEIADATESLDVIVDLLEGGNVIARGGQTVTLRAGQTTVAPITTDVVGDNLSMGHSHACYLDADGDAFCWGAGGSALGNGSSLGSTRPVPVQGGLRFASIDAGTAHTCALTTDGAAYCWGNNRFGQLGTGGVTAETTPARVAGNERFAVVTAGYSHSCGLTAAGEAYCWGENQNGVLGDPTLTQALTPTRVPTTLRFETLNAGFWSTCGIASGAVYCWGREPSRVTLQAAPTLVGGTTRFLTVDPGTTHHCAIDVDATAHCWGGPAGWNFGQLGNGGLSPSATPVPVAGLSFRSIATPSPNSFLGGHTCGVVLDGRAYCWGLNRLGQLGTPTSEACPNAVLPTLGATLPCSTRPLAVSGGLRFTVLAAGNENTCGLTDGGDVYCWGSNATGMLGQGDFADRSQPSPVGPPVAPPVLTRVDVTPTSLTLAAGDSATVSASAVDQQGLPLLAAFRWSSSDTLVAKVDSAGATVRVRARVPGTAQVSVTAEGRTASLPVVVN